MADIGTTSIDGFGGGLRASILKRGETGNSIANASLHKGLQEYRIAKIDPLYRKKY